MKQSIPDLIDNQRYKLDEILKILLKNSSSRLDVLTAFFNLKALEVLKPEIENIALRLLLGKEQEQEFVIGKKLFAEIENEAARGEVISKEIQGWRDFLSRDEVEIRRTKSFCHGKAYIIYGVQVIGDIGIVGSSNFTGAGLTTNLELNAVLKQSSAVDELKDWFEALWNDAEDYKAEILSLLEHFTRQYTPYEIYIKVIYEALRDKLEQDLEEKDKKPSPVVLADFQHDGYLAAKEILENYGGVLISDSVGLGKTYLALRLLDDYAYRERQTALIICPASTKETIWRPLLQRYAIPYELVSMEVVSQRYFPVDEYAKKFSIIVIDESHNFRNPDTNRWKNLFEVIRRGKNDKKVILLTATPVNNTVFDLYHQLRFITKDDPKFLQFAGIQDLFEYFLRAEINKEALYEVLEALAVRRSRQFIRRNYPEAEIDGQKIHFPERELRTVNYSLKKTYGEELYQKIADGIESLFLAPYQLDTYRIELIEWRKEMFGLLESDEKTEGIVKKLSEKLGWTEDEAHNFVMSIGRQTALAHIMRVLYLKRLESSVEALRISLERLHKFLEMFLDALQRGRLLKSDDYRRWLQIGLKSEGEDEEYDEEEWENFVSSLPEIPADRYDIKSIESAVEIDLKILDDILQDFEAKGVDDKLITLKNLLISDELKDKKIVVFSYFKDTARYIHDELTNDKNFLEKFGGKISIVDSSVNPAERTRRIICFAPKANNKEVSPDDEIDLLISTDVLSEGQNLQDAQVIINYDLHWNPIKMVQRIGRLDRIGSPYDVIYVYNFFPEDELEELLGLIQRLYEKLSAINRTVGLDASVLGEMPNPMDFNILRRVEGEDLSVFDDLEAMSELAIGEFIKQDLLKFLKEVGEENLKKIPLGMGTARRRVDGGVPGFFVAFRNPITGQSHWIFYDEENKKYIEQRLEAIKHIRCGRDEEAVPLPEDFDPRPLIKRLRKHLWNRIRMVELSPPRLPDIQRKVVNWLHALPTSAQRNELLQYFESGPLTSSELSELRRLWREISGLSVESQFQKLKEFAEAHPRQNVKQDMASSIAPQSEEDIECIAWVRVI